MMDGRALYPEGWHPQATDKTPDGSRLLKGNRSRTAVGGVRYYVIDLGLASFWDIRELEPTRGKVDIHSLGLSFGEHFTRVRLFPLLGRDGLH